MQWQQDGETREAEKTGLEEFLERTGMSQEAALELLEMAYRRQEEMMGRARQVMAAIEAIGDERFTVEALRADPEAMRAVEAGAPIGEVYRRFFLCRTGGPRPDREANLGLGGLAGDTLTPEEIERISAYVSRTGNRYQIDE